MLSVEEAREFLVPFIVHHEYRKMDLSYFYKIAIQQQITISVTKETMRIMRLQELVRRKANKHYLVKPRVQILFDYAEKMYSSFRETAITRQQWQDMQQYAMQVDTKYKNLCLHYPQLKYVPSLFQVQHQSLGISYRCNF